jgi:hypothetical protein
MHELSLSVLEDFSVRRSRIGSVSADSLPMLKFLADFTSSLIPQVYQLPARRPLSAYILSQGISLPPQGLTPSLRE